MIWLAIIALVLGGGGKSAPAAASVSDSPRSELGPHGYPRAPGAPRVVGYKAEPGRIGASTAQRTACKNIHCGTGRCCFCEAFVNPPDCWCDDCGKHVSNGPSNP